jgi:hypothetical protein
VYREEMRWLPLFLLLFTFPTWAEPCEKPEDCGVEATIIPDFSLEDVNPNSATFGTERSRDEFLGSFLLVYFAQAT